jgi:hypothetical protein
MYTRPLEFPQESGWTTWGQKHQMQVSGSGHCTFQRKEPVLSQDLLSLEVQYTEAPAGAERPGIPTRRLFDVGGPRILDTPDAAPGQALQLLAEQNFCWRFL